MISLEQFQDEVNGIYSTLKGMKIEDPPAEVQSDQIKALVVVTHKTLAKMNEEMQDELSDLKSYCHTKLGRGR